MKSAGKSGDWCNFCSRASPAAERVGSAAGLAREQNMCSIWLLLLVTFTFMQLLRHSDSMYDSNCALHCRNYVRSTFKTEPVELPLLSGHR